MLRAWESSWVVGVLQTPDYARAVLSRFAELHQTPRDIEEAVRSRMKRQEGLYDSGKRYRILGLGTVELGIVPLGAALQIPPQDSDSGSTTTGR